MFPKLFHNRFLGLLSLSVLGFSANWFKLELFFNVDFIFVSVFVLLASARYGAIPGIVSGVVAGSCTWLLWQHPWALIIGVAEAAVVGVAVRRQKVSLLTADSIYWVCCGAPLIWLFSHHVLGISEQSCLLITLKQSLNGICNAAAAQLIMLVVQAHSAKAGQLPHFRQILFSVVVSLVLFIGMGALVTNLREITNDEVQELSDDARHTSNIAAAAFNSWLQQQQQSVIALARLIGDPAVKSPSELQRIVETVNTAVPAFVWMGVLDKFSLTIAFDPPIDENGRSNVGVDFSDRPYIPLLRETLKPYIADIVTGKLGNHSPRAIMLAPLVVNGRYNGFCVGVADLDLLRDMLKTLVGNHGTMHITLIDRKRQVVVSTRRDLKTMSRLEFNGGEKRRLGRDIVQWIPEMSPGSSLMQRWTHSRFIAEQPLSPEIPWKVVVEMSPSELLNTLTGKSIYGLSLLLGLFCVSALIAAMLGRLFLHPLERLQKITEDLPSLIPTALPENRWPVSKIFELDALNSNFKKMVAMLTEKFIQQETTYRQLAMEAEKNRILEKKINGVREQVESNERSRISRDLHDGLGQSLQTAKLNLQILKSRCNNCRDCNGQLVDIAISEIQATSEEMRDIVLMLRPPVLSSRNLSEALGWMAARLSRRSGADIRIVAGDAMEDLSEELKTGMFRICQEALSNALRHGSPSVVEIHISRSGMNLSLLIHDNGSGFEHGAHTSGFGIGIMQERATLLGGGFAIESSRDKGTKITVEIPLS